MSEYVRSCSSNPFFLTPKNPRSSQYNHLEPLAANAQPFLDPSHSPEFQALLEALHTRQENLGLFRARVHLKSMKDSGCFYKLRDAMGITPTITACCHCDGYYHR